MLKKKKKKKIIQATTYLILWCHISWSWNSQTYHSDISRCHRKDIVGGQEVPAEDLVGQSEVALEDGWHLGIEVFSAAELLQHLHGQHEDLTQTVLLMVTNTWKIKQWLHFGIKYEYRKKAVGWINWNQHVEHVYIQLTVQNSETEHRTRDTNQNMWKHTSGGEGGVNVPGRVACSCRETPCWGQCCWSYWSWRTHWAGQSGWSRPAFAAAETVTWSHGPEMTRWY